MDKNKVNRNSVVIEVVNNICENCKSCKVNARDLITGKKVKVLANYCLDGSGYIDINLLDEEDKFIDSCKLKHPTDSCILPFDLEIEEETDCGCV